MVQEVKLQTIGEKLKLKNVYDTPLVGCWMCFTKEHEGKMYEVDTPVGKQKVCPYCFGHNFYDDGRPHGGVEDKLRRIAKRNAWLEKEKAKEEAMPLQDELIKEALHDYDNCWDGLEREVVGKMNSKTRKQYKLIKDTYKTVEHNVAEMNLKAYYEERGYGDKFGKEGY